MEITFIKQGISKTGYPWWIGCNQPFELEYCPNCGGPLGIKIINASPGIKKVKLVYDEGARSEIMDIADLPKTPAKCESCGWKEWLGSNERGDS